MLLQIKSERRDTQDARSTVGLVRKGLGSQVRAKMEMETIPRDQVSRITVAPDAMLEIRVVNSCRVHRVDGDT
jgi:hypothetical protein